MTDLNDFIETTNLTPVADSATDENIIRNAPGVKDAEFGYFKDVTIRNSNHSLRVFSKPDSVSTLAVSEGRLPKAANEIALDSAKQDRYAIDSTIKVTGQPDIAGDTVLKRTQFTVVGFVDSCEAISNLNMGQSTAGSGELNGYTVVSPAAFDSEAAMIGRVTFKDTQGLEYWSTTYRDRVSEHKATLTKRLADPTQSPRRLDSRRTPPKRRSKPPSMTSNWRAKR